MRLVFLCLALSVSCLAQTQGNLPTVIDGTTSHLEAGGCGFNCINTPENLAVGDLIFVGFTMQNAPDCGFGSNPPWTFNSSSGNAFTLLTAATSTNPGNKIWHQFAYSFVTVAGADQLTVTGGTDANCIGSMVYGRIGHFTGSVDGSVQSCVSSGPSGISTCSTSNTTTANGDILVTFASSDVGAGSAQAVVGPNVQPIAADYHNGNGGTDVLGYINATSIGATSVQMYARGGNSAQQVLAQTIAFKPSITITTTALPDMISGSPYDATLGCIGGTSALTFAETGALPSGITFNTTTGHLSGTPSGSGSFSIDVSCTDGTVTSATQTLPFKVGAAQGTPALVQSQVANGNGGGSSFNVTSTHCGDVLILTPLALDSGGAMIGVQAFNGLSNKYTISSGDPVQRIIGVSGNGAGPFSVIAMGPLTTTGTVTITTANNQDASSGLEPMLVAEFSNVQGVIDPLSFTQTLNAGSGSVAPSYTTPVDNEMLLASTSTDHRADTLVLAAPFSTITTGSSTYTTQIYGNALVSSASTVTATTTVTTTGTNDLFAANIVGLRPRLPIVACGEGTTSTVRHRVQIY